MTDELPQEGASGAVKPLGGLDPLDDPARRERLDRGDMDGAIAALGGQLRAAADGLADIALPRERPWRNVAILGMGGSAMGADLVRSAFADRARLPIVVSREPTLPAWVDASTLVIASSHSGRTAETLTATRIAVERGASLVAVTSGGDLAELAATAGVLVELPAGGQPRAALGSSTGTVLGVLAAADVVDRDAARAELLAAAAAADQGSAAYGPAVPIAKNPAKQLARSLESRIGIIVGGGHLAPVARRWKNQLNENAKTWAGWDELPELAHNTIVGFEAPPVLRWAVHVVVLHGSEGAEAAARRAAIVAELEATGTSHSEVEVGPDALLGEAFSAVILGDWVSEHLAILLGQDPTPVEAIARYKDRLAAG